MAARALRLRDGHPPYSPTNHALIRSPLWARFTRARQADDVTVAHSPKAERVNTKANNKTNP